MMRNGWNMNREVVMYDATTDIGWRELDTYDHDRLAAGDAFLASECEERLVLRQYGEVVHTWAIYIEREKDGLRALMTPRFRVALSSRFEGVTVAEDDPSWSHWLDYANALTFEAQQQDQLLCRHPFLASPEPGHDDFCWEFNPDENERCGWTAADHVRS